MENNENNFRFITKNVGLGSVREFGTLPNGKSNSIDNFSLGLQYKIKTLNPKALKISKTAIVNVTSFPHTLHLITAVFTILMASLSEKSKTLTIAFAK